VGIERSVAVMIVVGLVGIMFIKAAIIAI